MIVKLLLLLPMLLLLSIIVVRVSFAAPEPNVKVNISRLEDQAQATDLVAESIAYLNEGRDQEMLNAAHRALELAPELGEVQESYGVALSNFGRYDEAADHLIKCISLKPEITTAYLNLGAVYTSMGNNVEAAKCYRKFLEKFPEDKSAKTVSSILETVSHANLDDSNSKDNYYQDNIDGEKTVRWRPDNMPLAVYIAPGTGLRNFRDEFPGEVKRACEDWAAASKGKLSFRYVDYPEKGQIKISWCEDPSLLRRPGEKGDCSLKIDPVFSATILSADIVLLVKDSSKGPIRKERLRRYALHEMGHALGIRKHSSSPKDIMYFSDIIYSADPKLSVRDINTLQYFLGSPAAQKSR